MVYKTDPVSAIVKLRIYAGLSLIRLVSNVTWYLPLVAFHLFLKLSSFNSFSLIYRFIAFKRSVETLEKYTLHLRSA